MPKIESSEARDVGASGISVQDWHSERRSPNCDQILLLLCTQPPRGHPSSPRSAAMPPPSGHWISVSPTIPRRSIKGMSTISSIHLLRIH